MTKSFISKIEKFLDHEEHFDALNFPHTPDFQIESNQILLEQIQFSAGDKQWEIFFSRLTAFFEFGMLIDNSAAANGEIQKMFFYGQNIDKKLPKIHFKLPKSPLFNILKTRAPLFLRKLGFNHLPDAAKMACLLIRVEENRYIVLMTKQAEPWLQLRCESLNKALICHDYN